MGKYYPKMHCGMRLAALSTMARAKLKIALTGVRSRFSGIPGKTANLILLILYFLPKLTYFFVKSAFRRLRK